MNKVITYAATNKISFPGISDGSIEINEVAFTIPGTSISVAWYGLLITLGIFIAVAYIYMRGKRQKLIFDDLMDIAIFTVIPGIIGARIYYVFFDWLKRPENYKSLYDVVAIWEGGLAIYGGIIFGALACILTLRVKKIRIPAFFDALAPAVMIAQSIGRWGNFCNGEAFGSSTTLPWAMNIQTSYDGGITWYQTAVAAHPTFLYESFWNLIGFILLCILYKRRKFDGQITLSYLTWYGFGRMFIEGLRTDSLYIGGSGIRVSQLLAFACFIVAGALLVALTFFKYKEKNVCDCIYLDGAKSYEKYLRDQAKKSEKVTDNDAIDGDTADTDDNDQEDDEADEASETEATEETGEDQNG